MARAHRFAFGLLAAVLWPTAFGSAAGPAAAAAPLPVYSEHQLGTWMDLTSPASFTGGHVRGVGKAPWEYADWGRTRAGAWLAQNSWKYGFILSYPKVGSPQKTCYKYEPWHFRYFGRPIAAKIHQSRLTAREWLWKAGATTTWTGGSSTGSPGAAPPLDEGPDAAPPIDGETLDAPSTDTVASQGRPAAPATPWGEGMVVLSGVVAFMLVFANLGRRPTRGGRRSR